MKKQSKLTDSPYFQIQPHIDRELAETDRNASPVETTHKKTCKNSIFL